MRNPLPEQTVLADRDCLIIFAAIALASDNRVCNHEWATTPPAAEPPR